MNILVTGAKGFVGKNLVENLKNIRDGKNRTRPTIIIDNIFEYDIDSSSEELDLFCSKANFVFNLAGVNRPVNNKEFFEGNVDFSKQLIDLLIKHNNRCPVMLSSSVQASLTGRYASSDYGKSKLAGEKAFIDYSEKFGVNVLIYRFTNIFGKWCKPNYNSAVATFCNNIANDLPITVNNESTELELLYIDDLINEMFDALEGKEHRCSNDESGCYCFVPVTHKVTLGKIVSLLNAFNKQPESVIMPEIPFGSFEKKLYSTFLSYLPKHKISYDLKSSVDNRGSFTEILKTLDNGQFSVNISEPGITKGEHWHNTKWEIFVVIYGHALIQMRNIISEEIIEFEVSGDKLQAVQMLPGYTHNIINLSNTDKLITLMWANEMFDQNNPDTYYEKV